MKLYRNLTEEDLKKMNVMRVMKACDEFARIERNFIERLSAEHDYSDESWNDFFDEGNASMWELIWACQNLVESMKS